MAKTNVWMSVSDLMTGLMVIFLFVSISYMRSAQKKLNAEQQILQDYIDTRNNLSEKLKQVFFDEINDSVLTIDNDLTMRFTRAETLFSNGEWTLSEEYKKTLADVMPKYLEILLTDSIRQNIKEIRIEGHTDTSSFPKLDSDPYFANLILSQQRARNVVKFIRTLPEYKDYSESDRKQVDFWLTANGYSYSRALDEDGKYAADQGTPIDMKKSRRVEIRVITDDYKVIEKLAVNHANRN